MRMKTFFQFVAYSSLFVTFSTREAQTTTAVQHTFPDLVHRAEVIAVGTVTNIQEQWDATRRVPLTYVTFSNLTVLKGAIQEGNLTLEFLGGHNPDGTLLTVHGTPRFFLGEKTVVFCSGNRRDFCPLVGLWQGLLRVEIDPQLGVETVSSHAYVPLIGLRSDQLLERTPETPIQQTLPLTTLIEFIHAELRRFHD